MSIPNFLNSGQMSNHDLFTSQPYNVNTTHPLIPNSQQYIYYKKYISIHSEDRDTAKFPRSSEFEIELPEDYLNVASLKLVNWTFPSNYNVFSSSNGNVLFVFKIDNPYNPAAFGLTDEYNFRIYEALFMNIQKSYSFIIEEGFYNPNQMTTELTNKLNFSVTKVITQYFIDQNTNYPSDGWNNTLKEFKSRGGYRRFIVVYHAVTARLWFGNSTDPFTLLNSEGSVTNKYSSEFCSVDKYHVPDSNNWGLPCNLGLPRYNVSSVSSSSLANTGDYESYNDITVPRFYYGDVTPGDDGYWLLPDIDLSGSEVHWVEATDKINLMGQAYMYMEIAGQNCIDETQPFDFSKFTLTTNQTNGIVNSSFAKLSIPTTPLSQWFDRDSVPYKLYYPPAERIRRLKIKIRYHNGEQVDFGVFNYSFLLEFTLMVPQILRNSKAVLFPPTVI
jgi:hypothetical protein